MTRDQAIASSAAAVYDALLEPGQWNCALSSLSVLFDAPMAAIWRYDFARGCAYDFQSIGFDQTSAQRYVEYYSQIDPATPVVLSSPIGTWNADEQLLNANSRAQWEYVYDFALPAGVGRVGGVCVYSDRDFCVYLGVQRRPGSTAFGDAARQLSNAIVPHLARATRLQLRMHELTEGRTIGMAVLDALRASVCVVDERRRVVIANQCARRELCGRNPVVIQSDRIVGTDARLDDRLAASVRGACRGPNSASGFLVLHPDRPVAGQVMVIPISASHEMSREATVPLALFILSDPAKPHLARDVLRGVFGLTQAESETLEALLEGLSASDYANRRGVSIATARTHISSLLAKAGVDSQAKLVALAKTLPSVS